VLIQETANHRLSSFGGAGGQHACDVASKLGIDTVVIHKYSSILSAYGMALADVVQEAQRPCSQVYSPNTRSALSEAFDALKYQVKAKILDQGIAEENIEYELYLNMRYQGTETAMMILETEGSDFKQEFLRRHLQEFNFIFPDDRQILIDDIRVRAIGKSKATIGGTAQLSHELHSLTFKEPRQTPHAQKMVYFKKQGNVETPVFLLHDLVPGTLVKGPAIIIDATQTLLVVPEAQAKILTSHVIIDILSTTKQDLSDQAVDPATLSIFGHRFMSIAEQMGRALQNTSVSLNIKERLDFSCAIFGPDG
jgi:5-oxoprolinase (ATP-hydrolysing)